MLSSSQLFRCVSAQVSAVLRLALLFTYSIQYLVIRSDVGSSSSSDLLHWDHFTSAVSERVEKLENFEISRTADLSVEFN